jgi:uncharacterized protein DUF6894
MPVFFFDIHSGNELSIDDEGMELRDVLAAQEEAARALAVFAQAEMGLKDARGQQLVVWVRDAHGTVMEVKLTLQSHVGSKPALRELVLLVESILNQFLGDP